mgnify:CR=1 FL=1
MAYCMHHWHTVLGVGGAHGGPPVRLVTCCLCPFKEVSLGMVSSSTDQAGLIVPPESILEEYRRSIRYMLRQAGCVGDIEFSGPKATYFEPEDSEPFWGLIIAGVGQIAVQEVKAPL